MRERLDDANEDLATAKRLFRGESVSAVDLKDSFQKDSILISIVTVVSILLIVGLTFRSVSALVLLVLVIQGACWIAFFALRLRKLLMKTTYRKKKKEKKEAKEVTI